MKTKKTDARLSVDQFLRVYPHDVRRLVQRLRKLVWHTVPELEEAVYPGWKLIGYRVKNGGQSHYFAFVAPFEDRVTLGCAARIRKK